MGLLGRKAWDGANVVFDIMVSWYCYVMVYHATNDFCYKKTFIFIHCESVRKRICQNASLTGYLHNGPIRL
jgi:hypothetical protein